jgi:hypothetical protein
MDQEIESLPRKLHDLCLGSRVHHIPGPPQMPAYQGQTVRERRFILVVPCCHGDRNVTSVTQLQRQQDGWPPYQSTSTLSQGVSDRSAKPCTRRWRFPLLGFRPGLPGGWEPGQ